MLQPSEPTSGSVSSLYADKADFSGSKLTGTGTLAGKAWEWKYLTFLMRTDFCPPVHPCPAQVQDANFVVPKGVVNGAASEQLIGRKQINLENHEPFQLYELEMDLISAAEFNALSTDMGCPAAP